VANAAARGAGSFSPLSVMPVIAGVTYLDAVHRKT
jgi:hypothetical protein